MKNENDSSEVSEMAAKIGNSIAEVAAVEERHRQGAPATRRIPGQGYLYYLFFALRWVMNSGDDPDCRRGHI